MPYLPVGGGRGHDPRLAYLGQPYYAGGWGGPSVQTYPGDDGDSWGDTLSAATPDWLDNLVMSGPNFEEPTAAVFRKLGMLPPKSSGVTPGTAGGSGLKTTGIGGMPSPVREGTIAGSIARATENASAEQRKRGMSPFDQAVAQLDALMNQGSNLYSEEDLQSQLDQAAAGINKQYGAQIGAIRSEMGGAKKDTRKGSKAIRNMYKQLDKTYKAAGRKETKLGKQAANTIAGLSERTGEAAAAQAADINEASSKAAAALGLSDANLLAKTNKVAQQIGTRELQRGAAAEQASLSMARNNQDYFNTTGLASSTEGTNRAADLYSQLQDYLNQGRAQIGELAGQRAQALAEGAANIQGSYASAAADAQQQLIDNKLALLSMMQDQQQNNRGWRMDQAQLDLDRQKLAGTGTGGNSDLMKLFPEQMSYPAQILSQFGTPQASDIYGDLSGSNELMSGYWKHGANDQYLPLRGNESAVQGFLAENVPNWGGLSENDRIALTAAIMRRLEGTPGVRPGLDYGP